MKLKLKELEKIKWILEQKQKEFRKKKIEISFISMLNHKPNESIYDYEKIIEISGTTEFKNLVLLYVKIKKKGIFIETYLMEDGTICYIEKKDKNSKNFSIDGKKHREIILDVIDIFEKSEADTIFKEFTKDLPY